MHWSWKYFGFHSSGRNLGHSLIERTRQTRRLSFSVQWVVQINNVVPQHGIVRKSSATKSWKWAQVNLSFIDSTYFISFHNRSITGIVSKWLPRPFSKGGCSANMSNSWCLTRGSGSFSIMSSRNFQSSNRESARTTWTKASKAAMRTSKTEIDEDVYQDR